MERRATAPYEDRCNTRNRSQEWAIHIAGVRCTEEGEESVVLRKVQGGVNRRCHKYSMS